MASNFLKTVFFCCNFFAVIFFAENFFAVCHAEILMHKLPVETFDSGGTLILSDSPEYVQRDGILYTDTVSGDARILFYHLNDANLQKKIALIVENVSNQNATIKITRGGLSMPSENYFAVGKTVQQFYMQDSFKEPLNLKSRERKLLLPELDLITINPKNLIAGEYDFTCNKPVKIFVLMYPANVEPLNFLFNAEILPKDEQQLRGTFKNFNRTIRLKNNFNPAAEGIGYVMICDDVNDKFKIGIDATDNSKVINKGNYGLNYLLDFKLKSPTKIFLSPLGGIYAGVLRYKYKSDIGIVSTPRDRLFFGEKTPPEPDEVRIAREQGSAFLKNTLELSELGIFNGRVFFEYSPPGASNLPAHFILMENRNEQ